ncbi:hypothetical protein MXB_5508, partial [Myxobolus squamalis]
MTSCTEWHYQQVLHKIVVPTDYTCEPKQVRSDFKKALFKAIRQEFPETNLQGRNFHWRQLKKLSFEQEEICRVMQKTAFFCFTTLPLINDSVDFIAEIQLWSSYGITNYLIARTNNWTQVIQSTSRRALCLCAFEYICT